MEPEIIDSRITPEGVAVRWRLGTAERFVGAPRWVDALRIMLEAVQLAAPEIEADHWLAAVLAAGRMLGRQVRLVPAATAPQE